LTEFKVAELWDPWNAGFINKSGIVSSQPFYDWETEAFKEHGSTIKRKLHVSCVDVASGNYIVFNETVSDPIKAIISSASVPFVFQYRQWGDIYCMDGGTVWNTNLVSAVERCREQVTNDT